MISAPSARLRAALLVVCLSLASMLAPPAATASTPPAVSTVGSVHRADPLSGDRAARSLPGPRSVVLTLRAKSLAITWHRVRGAQKYGVVVYPEGIAGPEPIRWVKASRNYLSVPFKTLPTNGYGGFRVQVFAYARGYGRSSYSRIKIDQFKRKVDRTRHYDEDDESSLKKAVHTVRDCAADGLSVAVGTAVVGAPFVAFSVPIPGIGEVTTGGLAAVAGVAGGGATVACFTGKVLGD